jgi:predicted transcriptional regulator
MKSLTNRQFIQNVTESLEDKVLFLLAQKPMSVDTISVLLDIPSYRICQEMTRLKKWGMVMPLTAKNVVFWSTKKGSEVKS